MLKEQSVPPWIRTGRKNKQKLQMQESTLHAYNIKQAIITSGKIRMQRKISYIEILSFY